MFELTSTTPKYLIEWLCGVGTAAFHFYLLALFAGAVVIGLMALAKSKHKGFTDV